MFLFRMPLMIPLTKSFNDSFMNSSKDFFRNCPQDSRKFKRNLPKDSARTLPEILTENPLGISPRNAQAIHPTNPSGTPSRILSRISPMVPSGELTIIQSWISSRILFMPNSLFGIDKFTSFNSIRTIASEHIKILTSIKCIEILGETFGVIPERNLQEFHQAFVEGL